MVNTSYQVPWFVQLYFSACSSVHFKCSLPNDPEIPDSARAASWAETASRSRRCWQAAHAYGAALLGGFAFQHRGAAVPLAAACSAPGFSCSPEWVSLSCALCVQGARLKPSFSHVEWVHAVWPAPWLLVVDVRGGVAGCSVVGVFSEAVSSQPVKPGQKWLSACCQPCRRNYWLNLFLRIFCSGCAVVMPVTLLRNKLELRISLRLGECLQFGVPMFSSVFYWKQQSLNKNSFHSTAEFMQA